VQQKFRAFCFWGIGTIVGTQHADEAGRRQACELHANGRDLEDCLDGANSAG
jgi:hypothetical protein